MPIGYSVALENGAPTASSPGAANTPRTSPTSPLAVLSPRLSATSATRRARRGRPGRGTGPGCGSGCGTSAGLRSRSWAWLRRRWSQAMRSEAAPARHRTGCADREALSTATIVLVAAAVVTAVVTRSWPAGAMRGHRCGRVQPTPSDRDRRGPPRRRDGDSFGGRLGRTASRPARAIRGVGGGRRGATADSTAATRVLVELDDERFEMWVRGRAGQLRVAGWRGGDSVELAGERTALDPHRVQRVAWQHVVGELEADWLGDAVSGGRLSTASNRVRALVEHGAAALRPDHAALARGLVIGDDRDQPRRHGRAVPPERAQPPDGGVRTERRVRRRRRRAAAAPGPAVRPLAADRAADRLVRRDHARRALGAAGRADGRPRRPPPSCSVAGASRCGCSRSP